MKKLFLILVFQLIFSQSYARDLKDLYVRAMLNPETFDRYVDTHREELRQTYQECLLSIIREYKQLAEAEVERCRWYDIGDLVDCIRENPLSEAVYFAGTLYLVIEGRTTWRQSNYRNYAILRKFTYESEGGIELTGMRYETILNLKWNELVPYLTCP